MNPPPHIGTGYKNSDCLPGRGNAHHNILPWFACYGNNNGANSRTGKPSGCFGRSEVGSRKSEVRGRKSEVGSRKSEVGSRKSEVGSRKGRRPRRPVRECRRRAGHAAAYGLYAFCRRRPRPSPLPCGGGGYPARIGIIIEATAWDAAGACFPARASGKERFRPADAYSPAFEAPP